jgi:hypothetical protein
MGEKNSSLTKEDVNNLIDIKIKNFVSTNKLQDSQISLNFDSATVKQNYYANYPNKNDVYDYDNSYLRNQDNRTLYKKYIASLPQYDILQQTGTVNIVDMTKRLIDAIDSESSIGSNYDWQSQSSAQLQTTSKDNAKIEFLKFKRKNILRDALKYETKNGKGSVTA